MRFLFVAVWVGWLSYWAIAACGAKATEWREPLSANWLHYALALAGTIVLVVPRATPAILARPFLPPSIIAAWLGPLSRRSASGLRSRRESRWLAIGAPRSRSMKTTR